MIGEYNEGYTNSTLSQSLSKMHKYNKNKWDIYLVSSRVAKKQRARVAKKQLLCSALNISTKSKNLTVIFLQHLLDVMEI